MKTLLTSKLAVFVIGDINMRLTLVLFAVAASINHYGIVDCHSAMVMPNSWLDFKEWMQLPNGSIAYDYNGQKSGHQCRAGCKIPFEVICHDKYTCESYDGYPGCACYWYKNNTVIEKPTLFDDELRTFALAPHQEHILYHPWRAPGSAPIDSPCGVAGGNIAGCVGGKCSFHKGGFGYGPKAEQTNFHYQFYVTTWKLGSVVEVAFGITANHGGGYSYRLCKIPEGQGVAGLTEKCFQSNHLNFVGDKQWIQYGEDKSTRIEIPAVRTRKGTVPAGSQWTKNPIPACVGGYGGFYYDTAECPEGTQFKPPKPDLYGFGINSKHNFENFQFSIVDLVSIPSNLEAGHYVLSFRWDVEQTPQVWNTCASVDLME